MITAMYKTIGRIEKESRLVAAVVAASAAGAGSEPAGVSAAASGLRVTAAVAAGAPGVELSNTAVSRNSP